MNNNGLKWVFSNLVTEVDFMDLTISIIRTSLVITLCEKSIALYLFIPPHSVHPQGGTFRHIYGKILRICHLYIHEADILEQIRILFCQFLQRGHSVSSLIPVFKCAFENAQRFMAKSQSEAAKTRVCFHVTYHPNTVPSFNIQCLFEENVLQPPGKETSCIYMTSFF